MRRPLFVKIFLGVCASFLFVTYFVWGVDMLLSESPSRSTQMTAQVALAGASSIARMGGEQALRRELKNWPQGRQYMTFERIDGRPAPKPDPMHGLYTATVKDGQGHTYALLYHVTRFSGYVSPPLPLDIGPHAIIGTLIGILLFSALLAYYLIAPISRIRAGFGRLATGDLTTRLGPQWLRRRDEIGDLAADFNKMAVRLEELVHSRDRLLADISHELRSPLARLQLAIALAKQSPDKALASLQRIGLEADKLDEMVGELLALARLESGAKTADEYFFVSEVASLVVDDARFEAQEKGVAIVFLAGPQEAGHEALVIGSGKLISRAIENIVRNALRFSRRGDAITIELDSNAAGSTLYIRDQGPGVRGEQLGSIFEPFVQADAGHGQGYGLGLAIARRAIIAHGGSIKAANGADGGLVITLWLPAAPEASDTAAESRSVWDRAVSPVPMQEAKAH
jgi:two-component system OmpR family sensor kinase